MDRPVEPASALLDRVAKHLIEQDYQPADRDEGDNLDWRHSAWTYLRAPDGETLCLVMVQSVPDDD